MLFIGPDTPEKCPFVWGSGVWTLKFCVIHGFLGQSEFANRLMFGFSIICTFVIVTNTQIRRPCYVKKQQLPTSNVRAGNVGYKKERKTKAIKL